MMTTKKAEKKGIYMYEATHMFNGKPAGFAGYFKTREEAEALRAKSTLSVRIKRVRIAQ